MLTSKFLKGIMTEAYPVIKRQVEDAKIVSGFRDTVAANGGDWSALKALIKAHVEDTLDEEGGNKRVQKILDKADSSNAYAGMLGLIMNEKNFIADDDEVDPSTGEITEPQSAPQAARDLATSPSPQGQVATPSQTKTSTDGGTTAQDIGSPADSVTGEASRASDGAGPVATHYLKASTGDAQFRDPLDWEDEDGALPIQSHRDETSEGQSLSALCDKADMTGKTAGADAPAAPTYAEPGVVVMENTPPEGIVAHPFAACWPVNNIDVSTGVRDPIVKIGKLMLDGRGRYFAARAAGIDYPVVQYDGADPLMDCIRWNLASRPNLHQHNLKVIASKLMKLEPARADDIMQAFGLEMAEAAQ